MRSYFRPFTEVLAGFDGSLRGKMAFATLKWLKRQMDGRGDTRIARTSWIGFRTAAIRRARRSRHTDASGTFRSVQSVVNSPSARERRRFFRSTARRARGPRTASVLIRHSSYTGRGTDCVGELFASEIFFTDPRRNHRQMSIMFAPLTESFSTGRSSTARRPSRKASSFRPRAASITPSTHHAGP